MSRRLQRWLIHRFKRWEQPAAWVMLTGSFILFVGVLVGLIAVGDVKWLTLLMAADTFLSGVSNMQDALDD